MLLLPPAGWDEAAALARHRPSRASNKAKLRCRAAVYAAVGAVSKADVELPPSCWQLTLLKASRSLAAMMQASKLSPGMAPSARRAERRPTSADQQRNHSEWVQSCLSQMQNAGSPSLRICLPTTLQGLGRQVQIRVHDGRKCRIEGIG